MAKSRSQIQKEYRERKKLKDGKNYLKKESARVIKYYVPAAELPTKERKKRNARAKVHNQTHRRKRNAAALVLNESVTESSGYESIGSPLVVKLPLVGRRKGGKKKNTRALARAHGAMKRLKVEKEKLLKKLKAKSRQLKRLSTKINTGTRRPSEPCTPNSKTELELRELNLTPKRRERVKRKLMLKNVVLHEISEARASTSSMYERQSIARLVSGKLSKKYRLNLAISKGTGICRKTLTKVSTKRVRPDRRICAVKQLALDVEDFMSREDNSRMQPGKGDAIKISKGEKKQTIILTNYLADLHKKFSAENPQVKISLATFCRLRPRHILTAKFISRTSCLCIKHQNMALKCQTLKKYNIFVRENPEHLIGQSLEIEHSMDQLLENRVAYRVWKQVVVEDKKKMKIIENTVEKNEFIEMMKVEMNQFASHVDRVRCQYREIKTLKDSLKEKEVLVQMDFAENYSCKSLAEVQSAYWNQTPVTIHPVVVYFRGQSKLEHKSIAIISDELSHCTSTVCTFLDSLVPVLKEICPNVEFVHYWTDSPSSQYRNKTIFDLIANHSSVYGIQARWNYFEAGHGKGPCDGLGGTIKRMADEAVKRGAVVIQDPKEFFDWSTASNMKEVKFLFVKKEECKKKLDQLNKIKLRPIKGTMKFHAVAYDLQTAELCTRETSCYCGICLKGKFCESWSRQTYDGHSNDTSHTKETVNQNELQESNEIQNEDFHEIIIVEVSVDDFIACVYEGQWYIGKILDMDDEDVQVTFLERAKAMFRWPTSPDTIWCKKSDVFYKLDHLEPSGKSKRFWKISPEDRTRIENNFEAHEMNTNK